MVVKYNILSDARGKMNGMVFSRNRGGNYVKNLTVPSNPQTAAQSAVRAQLAGIASGWRSLTPAQRDEWSALAENYPATTKVGDTYTPTGYQLYMTLNSNLAAIGDAALSAPLMPVAFVVNTLASVTVELTAGVITTAELSTAGATGANEELIIQATGSLSAGVSAPGSSAFKQVALGAAANEDFDFSAGYVSVFGQPQVGAKVFVRVYVVNNTTGQRALVGKLSTIVTTL